MKKSLLKLFLLATLLCSTTVGLWAGTNTTVYYAVPSSVVGNYTVKLNLELKTSGEGAHWATFTMNKLDRVYKSGDAKYEVYACNYDDWFNGLQTMQIQLYNGDTYVSQQQPYSGSWTSVETYNGKLYVHNIGWRDVPTHTIYLKNTMGWASAYCYFDSYWDSSDAKLGAGAKGKDYAQMTLVDGTTDLYSASYNFDLKSGANLAFTQEDQHNYNNFFATKAIRRSDFNASQPVFVQYGGVDQVRNSVKYFNEGQWYAYPLPNVPLSDEDVATVYDTNFALKTNGASAVASSGDASAAIDGGTTGGSRWESVQQDPQVFILNMGQRRKFNTIQIRWEGAYTKTFDLYISDDAINWTLIKSVDRTLQNPANYEEQIALGQDYIAQYVKFLGTARGTGYGHSFWEFKVFSPAPSVFTTYNAVPDMTILPINMQNSITTTTLDQNGLPMDGVSSYIISPAEGASVIDNKFVATTPGTYTITAEATIDGVTKQKDFSVEAVPISIAIGKDNSGETNIALDGRGLGNGDGGTWVGHENTADDEASRTYDASFVVNLGGTYDISRILIHFEGACSQAYHIDFSADGETWSEGYAYSGNNGTAARLDDIISLEYNTNVRYIRFFSTKAATGYGVKMYEFHVCGIERLVADNQAPVISTFEVTTIASTSATFHVVASDVNDADEPQSLVYKVNDSANGIENQVVELDGEGNFTLTGLSMATTYHFTLTATDPVRNATSTDPLEVTTLYDTNANLALGKTTYAGHSAVDGKDAAVDGKTNTRWSSSDAQHYAEVGEAAEDWWYVDLGAVYVLDNVKIWFETACPTDYDLLGSYDGTNWTILGAYTTAPKTGNSEEQVNVYDFSEQVTTARYVKIFARNGYNNLQYGFSMWEFEVYGTGLAYEMNVTSHGWASVCYPKAYALPEGVNAYYASSASGSAVTLKLIEDKIIPANEGVLVKAVGGTYYLAEVAEADAIEGNLFEGTTVATVVEASSTYVLSAETTPGAVVFGKYTGTNMPANKAYLPATAFGSQAPSRISFVIEETEVATEIESLESATEVVKFVEDGKLFIMKNGVRYNAMGQIIK